MTSSRWWLFRFFFQQNFTNRYNTRRTTQRIRSPLPGCLAHDAAKPRPRQGMCVFGPCVENMSWMGLIRAHGIRFSSNNVCMIWLWDVFNFQDDKSCLSSYWLRHGRHRDSWWIRIARGRFNILMDSYSFGLQCKNAEFDRHVSQINSNNAVTWTVPGYHGFQSPVSLMGDREFVD